MSMFPYSTVEGWAKERLWAIYRVVIYRRRIVVDGLILGDHCADRASGEQRAATKRRGQQQNCEYRNDLHPFNIFVSGPCAVDAKAWNTMLIAEMTNAASVATLLMMLMVSTDVCPGKIMVPAAMPVQIRNATFSQAAKVGEIPGCILASY